MRPVRWSRITNPFATRGHYASHADRHGPAGHHTGLDFGKHVSGRAIEGLAVRSVTPGVVVHSSYDATLGNWVGVYHADDDVTLTYWHLQIRYKSDGERVGKGDVLGRVGNTGNSTAPHLHVQINRGRGFDYHAHIDPRPWMLGMRWWMKPRSR